jgi:succinate dehydrogenase/fumarate reductase flavoprotein subunit
MSDSVTRLDDLWRHARAAAPSSSLNVVKAREAAAMLVTARWMYTSALARTETRGMHKRYDHLQQDEALRGYLTVGGLDGTWTSFRPAPAMPTSGIAA